MDDSGTGQIIMYQCYVRFVMVRDFFLINMYSIFAQTRHVCLFDSVTVYICTRNCSHDYLCLQMVVYYQT